MSTRKYVYAFTFPDEAARLAFVPAASDVDRVARQLDNNTYWVLKNHSPPLWSPLLEVQFLNLEGLTKTIYVRTTGGDDNNDGSSPATAFLTMKAAFDAVVKDFWNGSYVIDITDCVFNEKVNFPQIRAGSYIEGFQNFSDTYGSTYRSAVNIRSKMNVVVPRMPVFDFSSAPNVREEVWVATGQTFTPGEHAGRFLASLDENGNRNPGTAVIPIISNDVDTFTCFQAQVNDQLRAWEFPGSIAVVEPSTVVTLDDPHPWILDGIGGYTFTGIHFALQDDESLVATNCSSFMFESCRFDAAGSGSQRPRTGGIGLSRFTRCQFTSGTRLRFVGGAMQLMWCVFDEEMFSSGYVHNAESLVTPLPSQVTMQYCRGKFGFLDSDDYPLNLIALRCTLDFTDAPAFVHSRLDFDASALQNLNVDFGASAKLTWCDLNGLKVGSGGRVLLDDGTTTTGLWDIGAQAGIDPTTIPSGPFLINDAPTDSTVQGVRP